jgi:uncharacterized protein
MSETAAGTATPIAPLGPAPTSERVESLDVLRGVALLGILLLNIVGFGLPAAAYFNPEIGAGTTELSHSINLTVWALVDLFFEGAMRALFSMLFGAGVVMFTTGLAARSAAMHYRRNFWLLIFGLFDAFVLLWTGDVLLTYALVGFCLYTLRNASAGRLLSGAVALLTLLTAFSVLSAYGVASMRSAAAEGAEAPEQVSAEQRELAAGWADFARQYQPDDEALAKEIAARGGGYSSAYVFTVRTMKEVLLYQLPLIMFWDAAALMLLGMALYKWRLLDATRPLSCYGWLMVCGFGTGLALNGWELQVVVASDFDLLRTHGYLRWSYHLGRSAMALGYIGLVMLICRSQWLPALKRWLAAVGRTALSNYLLQSLAGLLLFTGAGLGWFGALERWQLYPLVLALWLGQLLCSTWWLGRFCYGPMEWLWRGLSYGYWPSLRR